MQQLQDQHVLILGLGNSGLALARWCARCGAQVTVADTRQVPPQLAALQQDVPKARFVGGAFDAALLGLCSNPSAAVGADLQLGRPVSVIFKSPGLSPADIATISEAANVSYISITGELALFSQALKQLQIERAYAPKVLAITGTNGKTTVTALTGQLIERAGKTVAVAGNIGPSLLDTLMQRLDADALPEVWVLELSSFQLDGERGFEPSAGAVLNVTQDHLDWHGSMAAYVQAKTAVFGAHGLMVLNREDTLVMGMLPPPVRLKLQKPRQRDCITFGGDMPRRPGDFGIESVNGMTWLVRALDADATKRKRSEAAEELYFQRLMPADALRIRGRHNAINALSALALAGAAGCALGPMLYGLREYRGEPHRVQSVATVNEVEYFDDSKGTNVGATVAALHGLGAERRVVLILGGVGKGQDFSPLAEPVSRFVRAVLLIGRDAGLLRTALEHTHVPLLDAVSMLDAVSQASTQAQAGDAVLMSPACASFDMFDNYEHRAREFVQAVEALATEAGVALEVGL